MAKRTSIIKIAGAYVGALFLLVGGQIGYNPLSYRTTQKNSAAKIAATTTVAPTVTLPLPTAPTLQIDFKTSTAIVQQPSLTAPVVAIPTVAIIATPLAPIIPIFTEVASADAPLFVHGTRFKATAYTANQDQILGAIHAAATIMNVPVSHAGAIAWLESSKEGFQNAKNGSHLGLNQMSPATSYTALWGNRYVAGYADKVSEALQDTNPERYKTLIDAIDNKTLFSANGKASQTYYNFILDPFFNELLGCSEFNQQYQSHGKLDLTQLYESHLLGAPLAAFVHGKPNLTALNSTTDDTSIQSNAEVLGATLIPVQTIYGAHQSIATQINSYLGQYEIAATTSAVYHPTRSTPTRTPNFIVASQP